MKIQTIFAAALLLSLSALTARAWDNTKTHPALTDTALKYADDEGSVTKYFSDQFSISSTSIASLPVVIGFGPSGVDRDIEGPFSRLNCSLNETDAICAEGTTESDRIPTLSEVGCPLSRSSASTSTSMATGSSTGSPPTRAK